MEFKRKILVIDDDRSVCEMIARTLEDRGYEVFTETHYKEGVERAREVLPELAFISLLIDSTNGLKVSKEIHAIDNLGKMPVIMLISSKGELDPKYTVTIGILDVLVKPLTENDIIIKTEAILGPAISQSTEAEDTIPVSSEYETTVEGSVTEEEYLPQVVEKTAAGSSDMRWTIKDEVVGEREHIHEAEKLLRGRGDAGAEEATEKLSTPTVEMTAEKAAEEETASEVMNGEEQVGDDDLEDQRDAEECPMADKGKSSSGKKILTFAAALALIAAIGTGTYFGLQFYFSGKGGRAVPPSARRTSEAGSGVDQQKKTVTAPAVIPQQAPAEKKEPAVAATAEQNVKKAGLSASPAPAKKNKEEASVPKKTVADKEAKVAGPREKGPFSLQIGYFADQKNAENLVKNLKLKGFRTFIKDEEKSAGEMSYRVLVGRFSSSKEALGYAGIIEHRQGIKPLLYKE